MFKRKLIHTLILMTITINTVFAQTWVETDDEESFRAEYTVITEAQFNRLLRQFEASNTHAMLIFEDVLLKKPDTFRIISGSRPVFNGYYFLLRRITLDRSKIPDGVGMFANMGEGDFLVYGNINTGEFIISFPDFFSAMLLQAFSPGNIATINSDDYKQKIELFFDLVKED